MRRGLAPDALGSFALDCLARILSTHTWLTLNGEDDPFGIIPYVAYDSEDALKVVRLLRVADERLRVDAALADLPKFKPAKSPSAQHQKPRTALKR